MTRRLTVGSPTLAAALLLGLLAAFALAAKPDQVKGGIYDGSLMPSSRGVRVSFRVSRDGRTVASLRISNTPLYCQGGGPPTPIHFRNAPISKNGTFASAGSYVIKSGPFKGQVGTKLTITGTFLKGRRERGTLTTTYLKEPKCSGISSYTATA